MTLSAITTSSTVYALGNLTTSGYNDIRSLAVDILGTTTTGYGYQGIVSNAVSAGSLIRAVDWNKLYSDLNLIWRHLNNSQLPFLINNPIDVANPISALFANTLTNTANVIDVNRYNRPPAGQRSTSTLISSQWTVAPGRTTWGSSIENEVTLSWADALSLNYFMNLGGRINFNLTYPFGHATNSDNINWINFINNQTLTISQLFYDRFKFLTAIPYTLLSATDTNGNAISIVATPATTYITLTVILTNAGVNTDLPVTNSFSYEYSTGALTAPQPSVSTSRYFGDVTTPIFIPTRILSVTTPSAYTWITGQTSAAQTITISNSGNTAATVSSIAFNNAAGITSVVIGPTTNVVINPGSFVQFTLAYTGTTVGGYISSFTVNSNNDAGTIVINTSETITAIPFSFTLTPSSITASWASESLYTQVITINPFNGTYTSYSALLSGSAAFSVDTTQITGPTIIFDPLNSSLGSLASGTYTANLSVTVNSITAVVPISITFTQQTTFNLGTWLSPLAANNAVVGMSYDVISGKRYLTIGVGIGADGAPASAALANLSYMNVSHLGATGDNNFLAGLRLYPSNNTVSPSSWCTFLKNYGSWPNASTLSGTTATPISTAANPVNVMWSAWYSINLPTAGVYSYEMSSDDDSSVGIIPSSTNSLIYLTPSLRTGGALSNHTASYTGTLTLPAGPAGIYFWLANYQLIGGIALQIKDPSGNVVWNTRTPLRTGITFQYWQEVYRFHIPANGTVQNIYASVNCLKDSFAVLGNYAWSYYLLGDAFHVQDDGAGNLTITGPGNNRQGVITTGDTGTTTTVQNLFLSFYYYLPSTLTTRYRNLDTGPVGDGTQTNFFTGFNKSGAVTTVLQSIPTALPTVYASRAAASGITGGGGGTGGGNLGTGPGGKTQLP